MGIKDKEFNQIAKALAGHFDNLYYVEIESGKFTELVAPHSIDGFEIPKQGDSFFECSQKVAPRYVHPDDVERVVRSHDKNVILAHLKNNKFYSINCRFLINGNIIHVREYYIKCEDGEHLVCCMENVEDEYREKEEQKNNLKSAEKMARRDELTGIRNKNAFMEQAGIIDDAIRSGDDGCKFGVVMCDINDLKIINDTRGHSFGDEMIQQASRTICGIFDHSPVFRIGGDEFVVVLIGNDFEHRDELLKALRDESDANGLSRTGPVIACGVAIYDPETDADFAAVFGRADNAMYENKKLLKSKTAIEDFKRMDEINTPITIERKRRLDSIFGALYTVSGGGYVFLNDMKFDYSRWSLALTDDFGINSEYMYHADKIWQDYIHPDDLDMYKDAVANVFSDNAELRQMFYRARKPDGSYVLLSTRGFVLSDERGVPEYFGGIIVPSN